MQFRDIPKGYALPSKPLRQILLLDNANISQDEFVIKKLELRQYVLKEKQNETHMASMPITIYLETDRGSVETDYKMDACKPEEFDDAAYFLKNHLGLSALIVRCIVQLRIDLGLQEK